MAMKDREMTVNKEIKDKEAKASCIGTTITNRNSLATHNEVFSLLSVI